MGRLYWACLAQKFLLDNLAKNSKKLYLLMTVLISSLKSYCYSSVAVFNIL